jgi:hypothetical protein
MISLSAVYSSITFYALSNHPSQAFMGLEAISPKGLGGYVENSTVSTGQTLNWTISISNRMGSAQFVLIIARLENVTLTPPSTTSPAAGSPQVATIERFVGDGDTSNVTFTWTLDSINQTSSGLYYPSLTVMGQPIQSAVGSVGGENFRWIFELWTYDLACGDPLSNGCFHYGYGPQTSPEGEWLQIWFNAQV